MVLIESDVLIEVSRGRETRIVEAWAFTPMLFNEVQKQNSQLQSQNAALQKEAADRHADDLALKDKLQLQQEENRKLEDRLAALEALLSSQTATATRPTSSQ